MPNQVRQWPMWPSGDPACSSRARAARARAPALLNPPARVAMFAHARCEHFPSREAGKALIVAGLRRSDVQMNAITCEREATQRSAPHDHRHAYHHRFVLRGGMPSHLRCRLASYSCVCLRSCSLLCMLCITMSTHCTLCHGLVALSWVQSPAVVRVLCAQSHTSCFNSVGPKPHRTRVCIALGK